jgi:ubiquinone/menaquinone biosynthesis C-methylase UbiE
MNKNDIIITEHYKKQALKDKDSSLSTIGEQEIRQKELEIIETSIKLFIKQTNKKRLRILDVGCGNGYTLDYINKKIINQNLYGLEFTKELFEIAYNRKIKNTKIINGDIRNTKYLNSYFDFIYTERCLINILDKEEQFKSLREIRRILNPNGVFLMIECFTDGLLNNNKARKEMGLDEIPNAFHNLYFDKEEFFDKISDFFSVIRINETNNEFNINIPWNFLSSHYFVARILHPLITKGDWVKNTEFVKFFSFLPPTGNYSPIQAFVLKPI